MLMSNLLINKDDFLKEIMIEDVYILKWKIPNSVLLKKRLYGVARKEIEIDTVYMNFSIRGAAYTFYTHSYVFQKGLWFEPGLLMGYLKYKKNIERLLDERHLESLNKCPLTGEEYIPLKSVTRIPLFHQTDYKSAFKHSSSAFVEEYYNKEGEYLDEEFFFSILSSRGFDIEEVRLMNCNE